MRKDRKKYDDDDGRTIASMNVDGMPWYTARSGKPSVETPNESGPLELHGAERRAFTWGVLKAVLLVAAVFIVGYLLFILFCVNVWFK